MDQINNTLGTQQDNFQLKRFLNLIIGRWYWVIGVLAISLGIVFFIIRYENPVYVVNTSFITKKYSEQSSTAGFMRLAEGAMSLGEGTQAFQEIPLLKSQSRIGATLDRVDFDVSYFIQGQFKTSEVYPSDYYQISQAEDSQNHPYNQNIYIKSDGTGQYQLSTENSNWKSLLEGRDFRFGEEYNINGWKFAITARNTNADNVNEHFFVINNPVQLINRYRSRLILDWQARGSSIINATIYSELPQKDIDFLNAYFNVVVQKGLEDKSEQIRSVIAFINSYIPQISDTLQFYQGRLDQFILENREVINGSDQVLVQLSELESEKSDFMLSNWYYDHIIEYIKENRGNEIFAPALFGLEAAPLSELLGEYLQMKWSDKIDLNEDNQKNPFVNRSNQEIIRLEQNIFESVRNLKKENYRQMADINARIQSFYSTLGDLQTETRKYAELTRMMTLYKSVFDNLITRRTDAFLQQASVVSDYQILTNPNYNPSEPVSPDKEKLLIIAILIGLGTPLGVLYIFSISGNKVVSKNDLTNNTNIPLLGYVGHNPTSDNLVVYNSPKSLVAESFRRIRANLQYYKNGNNKHVILITSSISAEGKTFCSVNLAFTYALAGKKTLIVGADMRKPSLARNFGLEKEKGLSNYLAGQCEIKDVMYDTGNEDLQIIPGGSIPPNPAELILNDRMKVLMTALKKKYDLVIIDTPPIGLVADAIELMDFSDLNLLIVRQNVTFKKSLHETTENYEKGQFKNMTILFNDVNFQKLEYGYKAYIEGYQTYGYGYKSGYFEEKPS